MRNDISDYIKTLKPEGRAFIEGKFVNSISGETIKKKSSYSGNDLPELAACSEQDVNLAVEAAKKAYDSGVWRDLEPAQKMEIMFKLADLMEENREELAILDTLETSRAYKNYYYDSIPKAIEALRYFTQSLDKYYDNAIPPRKNAFAMVSRVPLGVVGIITPWNDPMVVSTWKYAPALLMGNSVVIKPAEESSLSILKIAELSKKAGIPDGVFNVITGRGDVAGKALALHNDVSGIFFTGSSQVGKKMLEYSGQSNMKKVGLECGGKGPYIVSKNCKNVKLAARTLAANMFYNQGQICSAPSRVILEEQIYDEFLEELKLESERYVPANPYDINNVVGCCVSKKQFDRVQGYIDLAKSEAQVYQPTADNKMPKEACCINPTIITGITNEHRLAQEEIFGPVVVVLKAKSISEAVKIANDTKYGLAGAVWSDDLNEAYQVARAIEVGLAHVNSYGEDDNLAPFGGVKQSGLGKDKSMYSFDEYSDLKTVWVKVGNI